MNARKGSSRRWQVVCSAENPERNSGSAERREQNNSLKPILLLTALLFLIVAPAPDSRDIADMTGNFLIVKTQSGLMASEEVSKVTTEELRN